MPNEIIYEVMKNLNSADRLIFGLACPSFYTIQYKMKEPMSLDDFTHRRLSIHLGGLLELWEAQSLHVRISKWMKKDGFFYSHRHGLFFKHENWMEAYSGEGRIENSKGFPISMLDNNHTAQEAHPMLPPEYAPPDIVSGQVSKASVIHLGKPATVFYLPDIRTEEGENNEIRCTEIEEGLEGSRWAVMRCTPRDYSSF
jgi:hypothetical protein